LIYADSLDEQAVSFSNLGFINGLTTNPSIIIKDRPSWGFEKTIKFLQSVKGIILAYKVVSKKIKNGLKLLKIFRQIKK